MDAASLRTLSLLETEIVNLSKVVRTLSAAPSLADSAERSEVGRGVTLLKDVLDQWPGADSIYVGYETGAWLQVQRLDGLGPSSAQRLHAPANAAFGITLMRPTANGELPTRRVFEDRDGNEIAQLDIWRRGYDARNAAGTSTPARPNSSRYRSRIFRSAWLCPCSRSARRCWGASTA